MKIAIDESGDIGQRFWRGSTKWFVMTAVIVPDVKDGCGKTCQAISDYVEEYANGRELHFAHNSHEQHTHFLRYMKNKDFVYVSVALDKRKLLRISPQILATKQTLLRFCLDILFTELKPWLDSPIVLLDTSGSEHLNRSLKRHLLEYYGAKHNGDFRAIKEQRYVDSKSEPLVQLADYIAGAVRHHVDKSYNSRSYEQYLADKGKIIYLEDRIHDLPPKRRSYGRNKRKKRKHKWRRHRPRNRY